MGGCSFTKELRLGIKVEKEHSHLFPKNKRKYYSRKIALDHIKENKCYYSLGLLPMEKRLKLLQGRK
jgi:hypothetical protein